MSISTSIADATLDPLPSDLSSPRAKLVYLTLSVTGGATIDELQGTLDVSKLTLLSVLESLSARDLVERTGEGYVPAA